jgi:uncharacterized membrane protein
MMVGRGLSTPAAQAIAHRMSLRHLLEAAQGELVFWIAVLALLTAAAVLLVAATAFLVLRIRAKTLQQEPMASELMSKFRELHSKGELTDAEYRTIKTTLVEQLRKQIKDTGETV